MSENPTPQAGFVRELMGALPPLARTVLMWTIMLPLAIAISGMLLQVNVGALIQESLRQSRGQTVDIVGDLLKERITKLDETLDDVEEALKAQRQQYSEFDKRLTLVERDVEDYKLFKQSVKQ